ncbi:hypothetical protein Drorol1_Dr00000147 [Drosera rotundifolia]
MVTTDGGGRWLLMVRFWMSVMDCFGVVFGFSGWESLLGWETLAAVLCCRLLLLFSSVAGCLLAWIAMDLAWSVEFFDVDCRDVIANLRLCKIWASFLVGLIMGFQEYGFLAGLWISLRSAAGFFNLVFGLSCYRILICYNYINTTFNNIYISM